MALPRAVDCDPCAIQAAPGLTRRVLLAGAAAGSVGAALGELGG